MSKHLYIICGPNGAGKTTASYSVLPKILLCKEFVNADEIARGEKAHQQGYEVTLIYFWLKSPEQAIERVAERGSKGGHNIPQDIIVRRYYEGIDNLFSIYMPIVDTWILVNNSETPRSVIATGGKDQETAVKNSVLFKTIEEYVKR